MRGGPFAQAIGRIYTQGEGEFYQISHADAADKIRRSLRILADEARLPIAGFTAPAWLLSEPGRAALVEAGMQYSTLFDGVDLLQRGKFLPAPTIVYSSRNAWRRAVSRAWVRFWAWRNHTAPILRIAAHPGDFADPRVEASLLTRIERAVAAGRAPVTYRELAAA